MVVAKTLIKNRASLGGDPERILEDVNNQLCENNEAGLFVTTWLGIFEISSGTLSVCNAGHEYPAIKHKDGEFELIVSDHLPPLAAMSDMEYENKMIVMQSGDELFLYTDGVTESHSSENKLYGEERLMSVLDDISAQSGETVLSGVLKDVSRFSDGMDQFDDITMTVLTIK